MCISWPSGMAPLKKRGAATMSENTVATRPKKLLNQIRFFYFFNPLQVIRQHRRKPGAPLRALCGPAPGYRQVTVTFDCTPAATAPLALASVQVWPVGCVDTVTA